MDAPRRERRHHRKAAAAAAAAGVAGGGSGGAAAARAAYGDVFGGPPRFAAPFGGAPVDYAEVFGGVATTCSIPFLDLPPVASVGGDDGFFGCGAGHYGEIFGRFDFGDFAVPYEELFGEEADADGETGREEIASSSGSSRSSIKKESSQLDAGPSILPQHFKEHESSAISFPPDSQECVMSYNKTTQGRPDDRVEIMTTCTVDSSMDYVVGSCNFSHVPATRHVSRVDNGTVANGDNGKKSTPISASANVRSPESDFIVAQKQHIPAGPPLSENVSVNENNQNSDGHSTPSNGTPTDSFLRVSDVNVQTQPKVPPPPLRQQPKLHKRESAAKGDVHLVNHSCTPTSSVCATLSTSMPQAERRADTDANPSSAAAAMKEAMEYAEARLRAAKELLERKGDSFKLRKKPSHHRTTRSTEIKAPVEVDTFKEKLSVKKPAKEEKNSEDSLLDKHQKVSATRLDHCDDSGKRVLPLGNPQQMMQCCTEPCLTSSKLEKLGNWRSGVEFYELTGDDQKCKTDTATGKEVNCERTNHVTKLSKDQKGRTEVSAADSDLEKYEKLWEVNDSRDVGVKHVNLREENTASMEKDRVSIILEASAENVAHKEIDHSHFEGPVTGGNSKDDGNVELLYMNEISSKPDFIKDMPSSFSEACSSGNHANDLRDLGNSSTRVSPVAGTSHEPKNRKVGLEAACYDEMQCTSGSSKKLQEPPEVANVDNSQASQIKSLILEELEGSDVNQAFPRGLSTAELERKGSYASQAFPRGLSTAEPEAETYGREKFSFIDESFMHNENDRIIEVPSKTLISEVEKVGTEEEVGPCAHSDEAVPDQDAECPEEESDITLRNNNLADHEESNMLNVFEVASKLIQSDLDEEIQGSLGPSEVENRTDEGADGLVSDCKGKEAEETPSENSEKTGNEEGSAHGNQEDQTASETDTNKGQSDVDAQGNITVDEMGSVIRSGDEVTIKAANASETDTNKGQSDVDAQGNITVDEMGSVIRSGDEVTIKAANDCPTRISKDEPASCSEMCTDMQHLPQNAGSAASQTSNKSVPGVEKTEEVCKEAQRELPTERSTAFEEEKNRVDITEGKDSRERISKAELKHQQSHSEKSGSLPRSAEGPIPVFAEVSRKEAPGVQRTKERGNITKAEREREKDKEASRRLDDAKEREKRFEKERERENAEERERKKIEEQERAREREKDRLAVERATREAHERAFAEARERAEKMELERFTAARQRASAEARGKEERASADATAERTAREARIKAERAAVERATAEARERAIEKAKAEKAAADIKERKERYRSSFKESFKSTNLDIRQDTQFQRATSSSFARNPDSSSKVVEVESALRHKAKLERHQRTTERVTKALAEKNMRDLLAQREQAEKHRLAEFLDPEVKRWSNGKEGNLRALLSTLQYILGADSGWQPVPLTELITAAAVKKAYRKATLCVHPDKLQQRGATIRQKYICEKVFDLLKDAWNKFTSEER